MTPAEKFYLLAIAGMASVVLLMLLIAGAVEVLTWLDGRPRAEDLDDPQSEYGSVSS